MERRQFISLLGGAALGPLNALPVYADPPDGCGVPVARDDGWPVAAVDEDKLINRDALCRMADRLAASGDNIHAVLVVRRGKLVFERYLRGLDEIPGRFYGTRVENVSFDADTLHNVKLVTKCVASLAVGIAIDRGLIRSINEPIFSFFPELSDLRTPEKDRIQLLHALTMSMGLKWVEAIPSNEDNNDEVRMHTAPDPCRYVLDLAATAPAGQEFFYNTGALTLVSAIIRKATGRPLDEFARENLFEPLGIPALSGFGTKETPMPVGDCACVRATWRKSASSSSRAAAGGALGRRAWSRRAVDPHRPGSRSRCRGDCRILPGLQPASVSSAVRRFQGRPAEHFAAGLTRVRDY